MAKVQTVLNNEERMIEIQLTGKKNDNGSITLGKVIRLASGVNFIPIDQWEQAKKNKQVIALLEETIQPPPSMMALSGATVERLGRPKLELLEVVDNDHPLKDLTEQAAVTMVRETLDIHTLRRWLKDEGRTPVNKAIQQQIQQIDAPAGASPVQPMPTKLSSRTRAGGRAGA